MFIQTEDTLNPDTLKFMPGTIILNKGTADYVCVCCRDGIIAIAHSFFGVGENLLRLQLREKGGYFWAYR